MPKKPHLIAGIGLPFSPSPTARASLRAGTLYAIDGGDSCIYYGQVASDGSIGFFRYRGKRLPPVEEVISSDFMSRFHVSSIGQALRTGGWLRLGTFQLRSELEETPIVVQWSPGTLEVALWRGHDIVRSTIVHEPEIQNLEIMAVHSAIYHVPKRLQADFTGGFDSWPVGGPIWRERVKREEAAHNHPHLPWHFLPAGWVYVDRVALGAS